MTRRQFLVLVVPLMLVLLGFLALTILERTGAMGGPAWDEDFARRVRLRMSEEFVHGLGDGRAQQTAFFRMLNEYVKTFDRHAEVVPPWEVAEQREASSGQYFGVGVRTLTEPVKGPLGSVAISGVKPGGPADQAGVKVGDLLVGVDGRSVAELCPDGDSAPLASAIKGPPGTTVRLRLRSKDDLEREAEVVRDAIEMGSVFGARFVDEKARIGYARLSGFHVDTVASMRREVSRLVKEGMRGFILDLRRNLGGLLDQAVAVADLFLGDGVVVRVVGRGPEYPRVYESGSERTLLPDLPMAVLIDSNSASASEVLAGALRDRHRAVLVGEPTHGKFLVQTVEDMATEFGTALFKRTTAIYETPLGRSYQRFGSRHEPDPLAGIVPDLRIHTSKDDHVQLHRIFTNEKYADWDPGRKPAETRYTDRALAAATALLRGECWYPLNGVAPKE